MVTRKMLPSSDTNRTSLRTSRGRFVLPARSFVQTCWRVGALDTVGRRGTNQKSWISGNLPFSPAHVCGRVPALDQILRFHRASAEN